MDTCTFKLNISEIVLLSTGGGAIFRHYAYFIHKCLFELVRSEIN